MENKQNKPMSIKEQLKDVYCNYAIGLAAKGDLLEVHHKVLNLAETLFMSGLSTHLECLAAACDNVAEIIYEDLQGDTTMVPQDEFIDEFYYLESIIDRRDFKRINKMEKNFYSHWFTERTKQEIVENENPEYVTGKLIENVVEEATMLFKNGDTKYLRQLRDAFYDFFIHNHINKTSVFYMLETTFWTVTALLEKLQQQIKRGVKVKF